MYMYNIDMCCTPHLSHIQILFLPIITVLSATGYSLTLDGEDFVTAVCISEWAVRFVGVSKHN